MATNAELQIEQKRRLFMLLKLQRDNKGRDFVGLNELVVAAKAEMSQEDVAWVEKNVAQLD